MAFPPEGERSLILKALKAGIVRDTTLQPLPAMHDRQFEPLSQKAKEGMLKRFSLRDDPVKGSKRLKGGDYSGNNQ